MEEQKEPKRKQRDERMDYGMVVRILQTDLPGEKQILTGLTYIKGVSWSLSNAVCIQLKLDKKRKVSSLSEEEIKKIEEFVKNPKIPLFLLNRRNDLESGEDMHVVGSDLDFKKEFDIKRLKKIKSYKGLRHALGQPVRGQRTRGHFRQKGRSVGVLKKGNPSSTAKKAAPVSAVKKGKAGGK